MVRIVNGRIVDETPRPRQATINNARPNTVVGTVKKFLNTNYKLGPISIPGWVFAIFIVGVLFIQPSLALNLVILLLFAFIVKDIISGRVVAPANRVNSDVYGRSRRTGGDDGDSDRRRFGSMADIPERTCPYQ